MQNKNALTITTAALFAAMGVLLPMFFHAIGLGSTFLPMHIPILLCGLICGATLGGIVGFIIPFMSSFLTGMPPIFPIATVMAFELATYGIVSGLVMSLLKNKHTLKHVSSVIALVVAMLAGRVAYGAFGMLFYSFTKTAFTFTFFWTATFVNAWPGMILQIILLPILMDILSRTKVLNKYGLNFRRKPVEAIND